MIDKTKVGLYQKFDVRRTDGSSATGGKHDGCDYFVLDLTHDKHSIQALKAYAESCAGEFPLLARDLAIKVATAESRTPPAHDDSAVRASGARLDGDCPLGPNHQHAFTLWEGRQCEHCMQTQEEIARHTEIAGEAGRQTRTGDGGSRAPSLQRPPEHDADRRVEVAAVRASGEPQILLARVERMIADCMPMTKVGTDMEREFYRGWVYAYHNVRNMLQEAAASPSDDGARQTQNEK